MESLIRRLSMMYGSKPVLYDGTPLTITNVGDETVGISLRFNSLVNTTPPIIYYNKTGKKNYKKWDLSEIKLDKGNTLYLFGENAVIDSTFVVNGNSLIHLDGKLEALCYNKVLGNSTFKGLFQNVVQLVSVGDVMPNTDTIKTSNPNLISIYESLFEGTNIEEIPAGFIKETRSMNWAQGSMYRRMFANCLSLRIIPQDLLKGQTGNGYGSYVEMFLNCEVLEVAADIYLSAQGFRTCIGMYQNCKKITEVTVYTTQMLSNHCMLRFVQGCESLKKIEIKANTNTSWGIYYSAMSDCISLQEVKVYFDTWRSVQNQAAVDMTYSWMKNVSPTGTFICPKELADETDGYYDEEGNFVEGVGRGVSTVPEGWTIDYPIIDARDGDANAMALMAVISRQAHADGTPWVKDSLVMMKSEAEKVDDIGTFFKGNRSITDFAALSFFSITSFAQTALESCANITKLQLPITTTSIGYRAFRATAITSLYIPDNVAFIDGGITAHCKNVTSLTVSPNNTKYYSGEYNAIIEKDTHKFIMGCNTSTIPSSTKVIGKGAFNGIPITQVILPEGLEEIETMAFAEYQGGELIIPSSVNIIGSQVFYATKLTSLTLPDGLVKMESNLVSHSANLTSITIPASVTSIGNGCMGNCKKLTTINFGGTMSQWKNISKRNNWNNNVPTDCVIYCTDGNLNITEST